MFDFPISFTIIVDCVAIIGIYIHIYIWLSVCIIYDTIFLLFVPSILSTEVGGIVDFDGRLWYWASYTFSINVSVYLNSRIGLDIEFGYGDNICVESNSPM